MTDIYLTDEQWNRLPYKTTIITRGRTYGEIIGLLETHGIKDYQWTRYQETDQLAFPIKIERQDIEQAFLVKLTVPKLFYPKRHGRGRSAPKTMTYLENQSWRIFWWHLKSKLEAIEFGISDTVREFMYNINYALPDGSEINLGQQLIDNVENINKLAALPDAKREVVKSTSKELNT